ncbi:MAG: hypothetical protein QM765_11510 [Myxococcales bacterium]
MPRIEQDIAENQAQLDSLEELYQQNTEIIAQQPARDPEVPARVRGRQGASVAVGRISNSSSGLMKGSINELQGMMGGEMGQSMQQLRESAAGGEGQMRATLDLAKEMGSNIQRQQEMRRARGNQLFKEYQKKMGLVQPAASTPAANPPERQKIAES